MNIMFIFYQPIISSKGGVPRVTHRLTEELLRRGHNVIFVSYTDKEDIEKNNIIAPQYHIELKGRSGEEIKQELNYLAQKHNITHAICQTLGISYLFQYLPESIKKIAVCHAQPFSFMGISRKRIWNTNAQNLRQLLFKTASLISPKVFENYFYKLEKQTLETAYKYADKICYISDKFYPRLMKYVPNFPHDKLVAINNPNTYDIASIELPKDKENIVLWVGRVENSQKNATDFVRMWQVLSKRAKDWRAIMVGDGNDLAYIKDYVKKNNIERIEFTGRRSDTETFYKKAKYVAITSFWESWCLVLTEAMSYGCVPVVYDTYETLHDIVDNNVNGYILPAISYQSMADCLYDSMQQKEKFEEFSIAAKEKMYKFTLESTVDKWETFLNSL